MKNIEKTMSYGLFCLLGAVLSYGSSVHAQVTLPQQDSNCSSCHSAAPATLANLIVNDVVGCDYTDAAIFAGWGWNAAAQESCPPLDSAVAEGAYAHDNSAPLVAGQTDSVAVGCDYSNAALSDGWGWNASAMTSCAPLAAANDVAGIGENVNPDLVCEDTDGDGWGWNGFQSCRVDAVVVIPSVSRPVENNSACIDEDGDGYGWNGVDTCVPGETTPVLDPVAEDPVVEDPVAGGCSAQPVGTTLVSTTGPVRSTGNAFYPDNGPQCVAPANQFNGPGLGFGDFLMINNAWNGDKSTWDWSQCISLRENSSGSVSPSWSYDWGNENDLQPGFMEWEVKSYPEILYGAKSDVQVSAPCATTGLPVIYASMPDIDISYSYRSSQTNSRVGDKGDDNNFPQVVTGGDRNIAVESFLHSSCEIKRGADSNREFELMVWLDTGNERLPSGSPPVATYTDSSGRLYDVYVKGQADPGYIAYVARNEVTSGTLQWDEFFADAKSNAGTYGIKAIDENWCLANILFGSEIWWGEGGLTLDYYQITQRY